MAGRVRRAEIGAALQALDVALAEAFGQPAAHGALVTGVTPGTPAEAAGLRSGDILLAIDGRPLADIVEADRRIARLRPAQPATFDVWRGGARVALAIVPRELEGEEPPAAMVARATRLGEERLGLTLASASGKLPAGAYVVGATGSALLAGLEAGDRITAVNGAAVAGPEQFDEALRRVGTASVVALLVWRGDSALYVPVRRLGE